MKFLDTVSKKQNIIILIMLILIFIFLITPILQVSQYNVPSADDYTYGANTYKIWKNTHNIFSIIKEAGLEVIRTYKDWQGTFSAVFIFALQPSIFGVNFYKITTIILLTSFTFSNIFLVKTIANKLFNYYKKSPIFIVSLILIIFSLEFIPVPRESLFWWNGSTYYTLFYCIMLITIALLINLIKSGNNKNIINTIIIILLTIILGGSNYCTSLQYVSILSLLTILCFINKNNKKWYMLLINIIGIFALIISMIAPR